MPKNPEGSSKLERISNPKFEEQTIDGSQTPNTNPIPETPSTKIELSEAAFLAKADMLVPDFANRVVELKNLLVHKVNETRNIEDTDPLLEQKKLDIETIKITIKQMEKLIEQTQMILQIALNRKKDGFNVKYFLSDTYFLSIEFTEKPQIGFGKGKKKI